MKITEIISEDWNKVNHHDKTSGLSQKAVNAYRRENPGSKLQTAVTTKPSKLKAGSKDAKRRKSFCARMSGNKGPMKKPNGEATPKALALRRWHCESLFELFVTAKQGIYEAEGEPSGVKHLTPQLARDILDQIETEGVHAIVKSIEWGDGGAKELIAMIKRDLEQVANKGDNLLTPKDIHNLADSKGVTWDDEPSFFQLTKRLTGKEHLDDLNQAELNKVKQHLEKQDVEEGLMRFMAKPVAQAIKKPTSSLADIRAASQAQDLLPPPHIQMYLHRIKDAKQKGLAPQFSASEYRELEQWVHRQKTLGTLPENFAEQGVAESVNDYLWHGSKSKHDILYPQQANDTGGKKESNKNAVYATPSAKVAIAMGLTTPGSDTGMFPNDPQMVLFKGGIRKGQMIYLHKVPKDLFIKHNDREWYSKPGVEEVKPLEVVTVPVDKWLHLIRQATPQDLELQKKYMKEGVTENFADGRNPQDKGDSKRHGINTKASVSSLRKTAKQGGRKGQLAHWLANMKAGRAKK